MEHHKKVADLIKDPNWKEYEVDGPYAGYTMKSKEGFFITKSTAIIPCTPIEVLHCR